MSIDNLPEIRQLAINVAEAQRRLREAQANFDVALDNLSRLGRCGVDAAKWASNIRTVMSKAKTTSTQELIERLRRAGKL